MSYVWPRRLFVTLQFGVSDLDKSLKEFVVLLDGILRRPNRKLVLRFINSSKDKDDIVQLKAKIEESITVLNVSPFLLCMTIIQQLRCLQTRGIIRIQREVNAAFEQLQAQVAQVEEHVVTEIKVRVLLVRVIHLSFIF